MPKSVFDFRDPDMRGPQYQPPAQAPSVTATALRDTTQRALQPQAPARQNTMDSVFSQPNPYPPRDTLPRAQGSNVRYIGKNPNDDVRRSQSATAALFEQARNTNNLADRSAYMREALAGADYTQGAQRARSDSSIADQRDRTVRDVAQLTATTDTRISDARERNARDLGILNSEDTRYAVAVRDARDASSDALTARTSRANTRDTVLASALSDQATNQYRQDTLDERTTRGSYSLKNHFEASAAGSFQPGSVAERRSLEAAWAGARNPGERAAIEQMIEDAGAASVGSDNGYAAGGIVEPVPGGAQPALGPTSPRMPDPQLISRYQQYADGARAMGLTTVGFDEFASMSAGSTAISGAAGAPVAMAAGGTVPGNGGRMVIDSDPNAPTDSIPAVIDGQTPAKLDSGELVFPRHAVLYYGTDKLNKMIAKSLEAQQGGNNGKAATGSNNG